MNNNDKSNNYCVLAVCESLKNMEGNHINIKFYYDAYFVFRKHCRAADAQTEFESDFRAHLHSLRESVINRNIDLGESRSFVVTKPKPREVFAGSVEKRILDTLVVLFLRPAIEEILPGRMYNCRKGKGLRQYHLQLQKDMQDAEKEYGGDSWILGGDVKSFFMSLDKNVVYGEWLKVLGKYGGDYTDELEYIIRTLIYYKPELHSVRRSPLEMWNLIPGYKSLYKNGTGKGLPIGDLVSQWSALLILSDLGHFLKRRYGYAGIYMDDFYVIGKHGDMPDAIGHARKLLAEKKLCLNESKTYLQPVRHGIKSCGAVVYADRSYIGSRVVNNTRGFILSLHEKKIDAENVMMTLNSYFGAMRHFRSYNIRRRLAGMLPYKVFDELYIQGHYEYFKLKKHDSKNISKAG